MSWTRQQLVGIVVVAALAVGAAGGWLARSATADEHWATPRVIEGWAYQAGTNGGIGCCGSTEEDAGGHGYNVNGATWRDVRDELHGWRSGKDSPDCLPANEPTLVRLGVVDIAPTDNAPGRQAVAWLECL